MIFQQRQNYSWQFFVLTELHRFTFAFYSLPQGSFISKAFDPIVGHFRIVVSRSGGTCIRDKFFVETKNKRHKYIRIFRLFGCSEQIKPVP